MGVDFNQALGLTGDMPHRQKFQTIVTALGYEEVKRCIPFPLAIIKEALEEDKDLNNLSLSRWDVASGFRSLNRFSRGCENVYTGSPLTNLYAKIGVTSFSNADGVCILKECAQMWAEEEDAKMETTGRTTEIGTPTFSFYVTLCRELFGYCIKAEAPSEGTLAKYLNRHYGGLWCRISSVAPPETVIGKTLYVEDDEV